ncbi:hypothetical protein H1R78_22540 [Nocardia farcinica]|nr:hypothetical protein [Nocardia farcinica]MBC9819118.1 hypothetical protein [Nocardia farcinica]
MPSQHPARTGWACCRGTDRNRYLHRCLRNRPLRCQREVPACPRRTTQDTAAPVVRRDGAPQQARRSQRRSPCRDRPGQTQGVLHRIHRHRRVPDDIDHGQKRLTEVKNVQEQSLTEQIKDDLIYCQTNGYEFVLITDTNTKLTAPLQELVYQRRIKHVTMDLQS